MHRELPYRQIHMDFHTSPLIDGIGEDFNKEEFISTLKNAHVNSVNLFAKCHHGMYYYPTKLGTMHPHLKIDLFGEQVRACKENNIRVGAYTCVGWNEDYANRHPECLAVSHEGLIGAKKPFSGEYVTWQSLCLNNQNYWKDLKDELREIYENYHPEGFWLDIIEGRTCICGNCRNEMFQMGLDPSKLEDVKYHDRLVEIKFCKEMYHYIKSMDEDLEIYYNSAPYELDNADDFRVSTMTKRDYFTFIDIESLPSEQWGYAHFPVAVNYINKYEKPVTMMNGKFHLSWGDFGSIRNLEAMEYECFRAIANGAGVCMGDQLHPSGKIDKAVYDRIGQVFQSIEAKEPWLFHTRKVSDVGVVISSAPLKADPKIGGQVEEGVYRVLSELHILFDYINYEDDIAGYKLIILPDTIKLNEAFTKKLNEYTAGGGKILATGSSGYDWERNQYLVDGFAVETLKLSEYDMRYMTVASCLADVPDMEHILYEKGYDMTVSGECEVLAYVQEPYFNRDWRHFCSHRQTPVNKKSCKKPLIAAGSTGIFAASPLFTDYAKHGYIICRDVLKGCLERLLRQPFVKTDLPAITELTVREHPQGYVLHTLNYVIERKNKSVDTIEQRFTTLDKTIRLYTGKPPKGVQEVPCGRQIGYTFQDGYTCLVIEKLEGHNMFFIKMRG